VFCGTVGRLPVTISGTPGEVKTVTPGDRIVMVGGRIGADGIHGATFSSAALDESAPIQAVQIGDPITQKRMFDFLIEARDRGLYASITDNGAGGLSSSVGEMARASGGARLDLAKAPLKYAGLAPWEIFLSEAQERMTLAVPEGDVAAFLALAARREVEATVLGTFTDSGYLELLYGDATVALLDMEFLHEGDPDLDLPAVWEPKVFAEPEGPAPTDLDATLVAMLGRLNLASNETKARHYDHEVKGLTVVKPWVGAGADVPAEATVFLLRHGGKRGYVLSEGVNPFFLRHRHVRDGAGGPRRGGAQAAVPPGRGSTASRRSIIFAGPTPCSPTRRPTAPTRWRSSCAPAEASTIWPVPTGRRSCRARTR
jgi:phosphoribosylformylglycinamidine synthase